VNGALNCLKEQGVTVHSISSHHCRRDAEPIR
jgi:hypothetical protein